MELRASILFKLCGDVACMQEVESRLVSLLKYTMLSLFRLSIHSSFYRAYRVHVLQKHFGKSAASGSEKSIFTFLTKRSLLLLMMLITVNLCHLFNQSLLRCICYLEKKKCFNFLKYIMGKVVKAVAILPSDICNYSVLMTN